MKEDESKYKRVTKRNAKHTEEEIWCWCDPKWLSLCSFCRDTTAWGNRSNSCFWCFGTGFVFAKDPEEVDLVVHNLV